MYVTFTKAKKHRVLSHKEIFQLHRYFTLNIAIFAYSIFICNCMHLGERGGSVVACRTPERDVGGSKPTAAVLCP